MPSVDEKVVQLTLDNKQFNKASDETINSLEKLKKSLEFEGAVDSFDQIEKSAKKVNFKPMSDGVQAVANQFNALHTIADAALRNITNRAISAGENLIKNLSVDQISSGWDKFSDKTRSVGTLISQGFDMGTVTDQLSKLNWFTDETSYDFTAMVANIAKFTATGRDLEDSVTAMEGIANWAALSGQNAETASRAMYQLSQALGAGTMRLEDYRSIQNASMDTDEFRQKALDAAVALGTLQKVGDDTYKSIVGGGQAFSKAQFATQLTEGAWFTSDVMMKVFQDYSSAVDQIYEYTQEHGVLADEAIEALGDKVDSFGLKAFQAAQEARTFEDAIDSIKDAVSTGWMNTFEFIFGDYNEAKELWTNLANTMWDVFAGGISLRNEALAMWSEMGGRNDLLDGLYSIIESIAAGVETIRDAWREVWYGVDADKQIENQANGFLRLSQNFKEFANAIKPTEATAQNLKDIFKTLFTTIKSVVTVLRTVGSALSPIFKVLNRIAGTTLQLIADLSRMLSSAMESIFTPGRLENLYKTINLIANVISLIAQVGLKAIVTSIDSIVTGVSELKARIDAAGGGIQGVITVAKTALSNFWNSFLNGESIIHKVAGTLVSVIGGAIGTIIALAKTLWGVITGQEVDLSGNFGDVSGWFTTISDTITSVDIPGKLQPAIDTLQTFAAWMYKFFLDLFNADSGIRYIFGLVKDELIDFWTWAKEGLSQLTIQDVESIALVAALIKIGLEFAEIEEATKGLVKSVGGTFGALTSLIKNFDISNFATEGFVGKLESILNKSKWLQIGIGIAIMINALGQLAKLDREKVVNSLITFGLALGMLASVMKLFDKMTSKSSEAISKGSDNKGGSSTLGLQILEMSAALMLVVQAMKQLAPLMDDPTKYLVTFANIAALVGGLVLVAKALSTMTTKGMMAGAGSMILMAVALNALIVPIKAIAALDMDAAIQGIGGIAVAMVAFGGSMQLLSQVNWRSLLAAAPALLALSTAITILSGVIAVMSKVENSVTGLSNILFLSVGLAAFVAILATLSTGVNIPGLLSLSVALTAVSVAIGVLSAGVALLAQCNLGQVVGILVALTVAISAITVVISVAAYTAGPALALLGVALLGIGASFALFGVGVKALAEGVGILGAVVVALGTTGEAMGEDFPKAVEKGMEAIKMIIKGFLQMIPDLTFDIAAAIASLIAAVKIGIYGGLPQIVEGVMLIATAVLEVVARLGEPLLKALIEVIHTLTEYLPTLLGEISLFIDALFVGVGQLVWDALLSVIEGLLATTGPLGDALNPYISEWHSKAYKDAAGISEQVAKGVDDNKDDVKDAFEEMGNAGWQGYQEALDPDDPFDKFRYAVDDMYAQSALGVDANLEGFGDLGSALGETLGFNFTESASAGVGDFVNYLDDLGNYGTDLVQGRGGGFKPTGSSNGKVKTYAWDDLEISESQKRHFQKKTDEIMGVVREEAETQAAESGEDAANAWINNLTSGVTSPASSSKLSSAGKESANTIADAFKEELEKISRDEESADLLFELWQAQNPSASDAEVNAKKIAYQNEKIALQTQRANIAQQEYMQTLEQMGENAAETQEAYNKMLQEQIDLLNLRNELEEMQAENLETSADAFKKWGEQMHGMYYDRNETTGRTQAEFLKSLGFTDQQIAEHAADQAGYNYAAAFSKSLDQNSSQITDQAKQNGKEASVSFAEGFVEGAAENTEAIQQSGQKFVEILDQGVLNHASSLGTGKKVIDTVADDANLESDTAAEPIGKKFIDKFVGGAVEYAQGVGSKIKTAISNSINAASENTDANSDYSGMISFAQKFVNKFNEVVVGPISGIGQKLINALTGSLTSEEAVLQVGQSVGTTFGTALANIDNDETYSNIVSAGKNIPIGLNEGITDEEQQEILIGSVNTLGSDIYTNFNNTLEMNPEAGVYSAKFYNAGLMIDEGVKAGIEAGKSDVINAAVEMAAAAYAAACARLKIASPSKLMYEAGMFFDIGMANGIRDYGSDVEKSVIGMTSNLVDNADSELTRSVAQTSLQKIFGLDDDHLNLTAVVDADTSLASRKMSELDRAYSVAGSVTGGMANYSYNVDIGRNRIESLVQAVVNAETYQSERLQDIYDSIHERNFKTDHPEIVSEYKKSTKQGAYGELIEKVEFVQNNYSPKAISRVDTYRDTKRQLDTFARKFNLKT